MKRSVQSAALRLSFSCQPAPKLRRLEEHAIHDDATTIDCLPEELYESIACHLAESKATLLCLKMTSTMWRTILKRRTDLLPEVSPLPPISWHTSMDECDKLRNMYRERFCDAFLNDATLEQFNWLAMVIFKQTSEKFAAIPIVAKSICAAGNSDIFIALCNRSDAIIKACDIYMTENKSEPFDFKFIRDITLTAVTDRRYFKHIPFDTFVKGWVRSVTRVNAKKYDSPYVGEHIAWVEQMYLTRFNGKYRPKHGQQQQQQQPPIDVDMEKKILLKLMRSLGIGICGLVFECLEYPKNIALFKWLIDSSRAIEYVQLYYPDPAENMDIKNCILTAGLRRAALCGDIAMLEWIIAHPFFESAMNHPDPNLMHPFFTDPNYNCDNFMSVIDWFVEHGFSVPGGMILRMVSLVRRCSLMSFAWLLREFHSPKPLFRNLTMAKMIATFEEQIGQRDNIPGQSELLTVKYELLQQWIENGEKLPETFINVK